MKSVLQEDKECWVCGKEYNLQDHHVFYGSANRKQSEKYGMKVWLCQEHHTGDAGVHFDKHLNERLKQYAQTKFNEIYDDDFVSIFGRNYL